MIVRTQSITKKSIIEYNEKDTIIITGDVVSGTSIIGGYSITVNGNLGEEVKIQCGEGGLTINGAVGKKSILESRGNIEIVKTVAEEVTIKAKNNVRLLHNLGDNSNVTAGGNCLIHRINNKKIRVESKEGIDVIEGTVGNESFLQSEGDITLEHIGDRVTLHSGKKITVYEDVGIDCCINCKVTPKFGNLTASVIINGTTVNNKTDDAEFEITDDGEMERINLLLPVFSINEEKTIPKKSFSSSSSLSLFNPQNITFSPVCDANRKILMYKLEQLINENEEYKKAASKQIVSRGYNVLQHFIKEFNLADGMGHTIPDFVESTLRLVNLNAELQTLIINTFVDLNYQLTPNFIESVAQNKRCTQELHDLLQKYQQRQNNLPGGASFI